MGGFRSQTKPSNQYMLQSARNFRSMVLFENKKEFSSIWMKEELWHFSIIKNKEEVGYV